MARLPQLSYQKLVNKVKRTFIAAAPFLGENLTHWSYPDGGVEPQLLTGDVSVFRSYSNLQLATDITADVTEELQFVLGRTTDHVYLNIIIDKNGWTEAGCFEIVGYEPKVYRNRLIFKDYASLICQVCCGREVSFKEHKPYEKGDTNIKKKTLLACAQVFVDFLNLESH